MSDTFDGASLDPCWSVIHPEAVAVAVHDGALFLTLTQQALWFNASQGVLVHKTVTGDFKATSRVRARKTSDPNAAPNGFVHLGGLMARDPSGPPENYVFIVVGNDENDISVETKTTVDGGSAYEGPSWGASDVELRICRVGSVFHLLKRPFAGGGWAEAKAYMRPDLPATLQIGANIYSASAPDLTVSFEEIMFASVASEAECMTDG